MSDDTYQPRKALIDLINEAIPKIQEPTESEYGSLVHHRLIEAELDFDAPIEYRGAEVLPSVMEALRERPVSLYLYGPPGTGKTRQGWALSRQDRLFRAKSLIADGEVIDCRTYEGERLKQRNNWAADKLSQLVAGDRVHIITESADIRAQRYNREALDRWSAYPKTLIVDDIGFMDPNDWVKEAIYHLANERRSNGRRTIWTSNLDPDGLRAMFGAAITSRLTGGTILNLDGKDRRS